MLMKLMAIKEASILIKQIRKLELIKLMLREDKFIG
jgi:hypothetical protein